ncbi:MAG: DUF5060 domain-containing protein [Armatimonadota bacterium]|nr:DUF5060 domain-containing protein [Armatimonadota bacterium]
MPAHTLVSLLSMVALGAPVTEPNTLASSGPLALSNVVLNARRVPRYEKLEIRFDLSGEWDNPFDPAQIAVDALFETPDGKRVTVPGFYYQEYRRLHANDRETLIPADKPLWMVRFSPTEVGPYRVVIRANNRGRTVESEPISFEGTANSNKPGFVRVSSQNPFYFQRDDGSPFFVVGENAATLRSLGTGGVDKWYASLARAGGNFTRVWWCAGGTDLESRVSEVPGQGLGRYKLDQAWRIDYVVELADRLGIAIMACLETQQYLRRNAWWNQFTYNAANGGPVNTPGEFFTSEAAETLFRNRLRYIVARWGYSTAVFSWQFWNEVSACDDFNAAAAARWHQRMARYLREIDPYHHLIHSNFGNMDGYAEVDGLPEMEVVSTNIYSRRDMGQTAAWGTRLLTQHYRKPYLLTEYGVGHRGRWVQEDPRGIIVHNGLWGALMAGSAGAGLPWGWDDWIDAQNFYHYWEPVAELVRGVPFHRRQWKPVEVASLTWRDRRKRPYYAHAFVEGWPRNYSYTLAKPPRPERYRVLPNGELDRPEWFDAVLRAGKSQHLTAEWPVDGVLVVHVPELELYAKNDAPVLQVAVDGREVLSQRLVPTDPEHFWEFWQWYELPVSAGKHEVEVRNAGTGAFHTAYELRRYVRRTGPDLEVMGLHCEDYLLLWARNPQFIWIFDREGRALEEQGEGLLTLSGVADGNYAVTWWETTTGEALARQTARAAGGKISLRTPPITRSAAAKAVKLDG